MFKLFKLLFWKIKTSIYWSAKWMWYVEKRSFLSPKNSWIILWKHRLSFETSTSNLTVIAPTRQGKSSRIVIQNILWCSGNVVVTDPSGELFQKTSGHMAKRGYKIQVYQPADISNSLSHNPLYGKTTPQELSKLADSIAQNNSNTGDDFWTAWGSEIIFICMKALVKSGVPGWIHLWNVSHLINLIQQWGDETDSFFEEHLDDVSYEDYKAFILQDEKILSWYLSSAKTSLKPWWDPDVVKLTSSNTVDIQALRSWKTIIYVIVPEKDTSYFSFIVNLFYSSCFDYCMDVWDDDVYKKKLAGEKKKIADVYYLLDEFWNLGNIKNFATNITTLWKRGCSISLFLQNLSQLRKCYGKDDSDSIFSWWTANKLILWWCDLEICSYLERMLWKKTEQETVIEVNDKKRTVTVWKPLLSCDQIRMLDRWESVLISGSKKPVKVMLRSCYEDKNIKKLIGIKPYTIESDLLKSLVEYVKF